MAKPVTEVRSRPRLTLRAPAMPGLGAAAAAISYRETGDPFAGTPPGRHRTFPLALTLKRAGGRERLYAARPFCRNERVLELNRVTWRPDRDRDTVEHPYGGHVFHPVLAAAAHSCEPNCRVSFFDRALLAIAPIAPGEAITIDYKATDRRLSHPFECRCGAQACRGRVA